MGSYHPIVAGFSHWLQNNCQDSSHRQYLTQQQQTSIPGLSDDMPITASRANLYLLDTVPGYMASIVLIKYEATNFHSIISHLSLVTSSLDQDGFQAALDVGRFVADGDDDRCLPI